LNKFSEFARKGFKSRTPNIPELIKDLFQSPGARLPRCVFGEVPLVRLL
jgi:hypothetical protein